MSEQTAGEEKKVTEIPSDIKTGRRKESIARVWFVPGDGTQFTVNGKTMESYFSRIVHQIIVRQPLKLVKAAESYNVVATVRGGGESGQAGAIRMGIARVLLALDPTAKKSLRQGGFLTRDPRAKERKKYGRRGARRGIQYSKR